jgi:diaminohydroxyphosphoribosylaminopyrimidine deaminase/5-amino-6-(5-phosphoribosylamino)uracil reductase
VVYGFADPNPAHAGAADDILKKAGITVRARVLEKECGEILRPFAKVQRTGLPWVIWKCAMSLDGRITRPEGEGQWLSGAESRAEVQRLRAEVDAILTSGETVRRDKPSLTIRVPELLEGRDQPWRVVLTDRPESMPDEAPLFTDEWKNRTLIRSGGLEETLRELARERGVLSVMLEAGGKLSAAMFAAGLVDEAVIYHAPILCGGGTLPALAGGFTESMELREVTWKNFGADRRVRGLFGGKGVV